VAAIYKRYGHTAIMIQCGEMTSGTGYGTLLHY
jgi:hypothetical protein